MRKIIFLGIVQFGRMLHLGCREFESHYPDAMKKLLLLIPFLFCGCDGIALYSDYPTYYHRPPVIMYEQPPVIIHRPPMIMQKPDYRPRPHRR